MQPLKGCPFNKQNKKAFYAGITIHKRLEKSSLIRYTLSIN
jgi:hypothetical protein